MTKKKLFSVLAGLALLSGSQAFAWVGGPFDNGDYSATLDNEGVYQASFRFKNGSGFAQWGSNVDLGASVSSTASGGGGSTTSSNSTVGTMLNRAVFYYKGIAFFGTATGMVDMDRREVSCYVNAQSEVTLSDTASTNTGNTFFLFGTSNTVNAASTAVNNGGRGFVLNTNVIAKITKTYPQLRFSGSGELSILGPDVTPILSGIAQQLAQNTDDGLTGGTTTTVNPGPPVTVTTTTNTPVITNPDFINAITPQTIDEVQENAERVKTKVFGARRFFLGIR